MKKLLSVIVPVYNSGKYIKQCVNSILNQTYSDLEIILIDDGSTDDSGEICDKYEKEDKRVRVIHQENCGCIKARLSGLQNSNGKYIGFVDSDDWIDVDLYQTLMSVAEEKNCDIVSMGYTAVYESGIEKIDDSVFFGFYEKDKNLDTLLAGMMYEETKKRRGVHPSLCSKVIKRELLIDAYDKVDENIIMGEDAVIFYPCCLNAKRIFIMREYKYYYRIHNESMCRSMNINTILNIYSFYQHMQKIISTYKEKYHLQKQLKKYVWTFIFSYLQQVFNIQPGALYLFPYSEIDKGKDIILYGAGNVGESYYSQLAENHYCNIIAWADKAGSNKRSDIIYPEQISDFEYNKIIIAVGDKHIAEEIMDELYKLGIEKEKILWCQPQKMLFDFL